jgi:hypothetical protein
MLAARHLDPEPAARVLASDRRARRVRRLVTAADGALQAIVEAREETRPGRHSHCKTGVRR